jgi:hypothetical protein
MDIFKCKECSHFVEENPSWDRKYDREAPLFCRKCSVWHGNNFTIKSKDKIKKQVEIWILLREDHEIKYDYYRIFKTKAEAEKFSKLFSSDLVLVKFISVE